MNKFFPFVALFIGIFISGSLQAQTFTVQKYSIGGEGGTDYLTAEPGTEAGSSFHVVPTLWSSKQLQAQ